MTSTTSLQEEKIKAVPKKREEAIKRKMLELELETKRAEPEIFKSRKEIIKIYTEEIRAFLSPALGKFEEIFRRDMRELYNEFMSKTSEEKEAIFFSTPEGRRMLKELTICYLDFILKRGIAGLSDNDKMLLSPFIRQEVTDRSTKEYWNFLTKCAQEYLKHGSAKRAEQFLKEMYDCIISCAQAVIYRETILHEHLVFVRDVFRDFVAKLLIQLNLDFHTALEEASKSLNCYD